MKKFGFLVLGFFLGILTTIVVLYLISISDQYKNGIKGLSIFSEKGECIETSDELEIFQVMKSNMALAETGDISNQIMVLLINYEKRSYYDGQKIKIPINKCARQIGIYNYTTKIGIEKTVPAVVIE